MPMLSCLCSHAYALITASIAKHGSGQPFRERLLRALGGSLAFLALQAVQPYFCEVIKSLSCQRNPWLAATRGQRAEAPPPTHAYLLDFLLEVSVIY